MKRVQPLARFLVLVSLGVVQLNATAWAQPVPNAQPAPSSSTLSTCVRGAINASKHVFVALRPGIQLAALGAGFALTCKLVAEAVKGSDFRVNGNLVGQQFALSVVDNSKSCSCPTR